MRANMSKSNRSVVVMEAMEQRMLFDASALTETIVSRTLKASVSSSLAVHATVTVRVANDSGTAQSGPFNIGVFIAAGTLNIPSRNFGVLGNKHFNNLVLANGKSKTVVVPINLKANVLAVGTDTLYAVAVDPSSAFSQSVAGGTLVVTPPPPPVFSDAILTATPLYTVSGAEEHANQLDFTMAIRNTGALSSGNDQFALFASTSSTFDSSATQIGDVFLNLRIIHNGLRKFLVNLNIPDLGNAQGTEVDRFVFLQVTDTAGDVTLASFPTQLKLVGPVA